MKKLLLSLLGLSTVACQPQTASTRVAEAKAPAPMAPQAMPAATAAALPPLFTAADTLTAPMRTLLRTYDLAALWQNKEARYDSPVMEGFFGFDHYHFALVFSRVRRDSLNPARYYVVGKCRYRKNIRPFSGTLTVRQVVGLSYPGFLSARGISESSAADSVQGRTYTARAQLQLAEEQKENSGVFEGEALLDFYVVPGQLPGYVTPFNHEGLEPDLPTRGGSLLLRGNRRNVSTGQVKPFTVGPWLAAVAPGVFKDFMLDDRMGQINPKYLKLGWNELWDNEEWWNDNPKPKALL